MALFGRKKSTPAEKKDQPATSTGGAGSSFGGKAVGTGEGNGPPSNGDGKPVGGDGFEPQPDNARKWFDFAQVSAASYNYEAALHYFANGIRLDPSTMSAHESMFEAAIQYLNRGGEPATNKELRQLDGPHEVHKFAAAEFAWLKDYRNAALALKFLEAAVKASQLEVGNWAAARILSVVGGQKKASKTLVLQAKELFAKVHAWDQAIAAGEAALRLDPTDSKLSGELKDFLAQRSMDQAGYAEAAGKEGGYRSFVKDSEKQRELTEAESLTGSQSVDERNLERAHLDYEKSPGTPDVINRYAQLLKKQGTTEAEQQAYEVYMRGHDDTKEYRFRMAAGDLRIEQARRLMQETRQELDHHPADEERRIAFRNQLAALHELQVTEFSERLEKYPTDRKIKAQLGEVLLRLGRYDDAMVQLQVAKDEPRLRVKAGYLFAQCCAAVDWHREAILEYKEALGNMDVSERDLENQIRYDLMESLIAHAREERSPALAKEALEICSDIARKDITFRDIRARRTEIGLLIKELGIAPSG